MNVHWAQEDLKKVYLTEDKTAAQDNETMVEVGKKCQMKRRREIQQQNGRGCTREKVGEDTIKNNVNPTSPLSPKAAADDISGSISVRIYYKLTNNS